MPVKIGFDQQPSFTIGQTSATTLQNTNVSRSWSTINHNICQVLLLSLTVGINTVRTSLDEFEQVWSTEMGKWDGFFL